MKNAMKRTLAVALCLSVLMGLFAFVPALAAAKQLATPQLPTLASKKSGMQIRWKAVSGAEMYRVYRKAPGETQWSRAGDTTELSLIDKKVESGKAYSYTIRCVSKDGKTNMSDFDRTGKTGTFIATPVLKSVSNTSSGVKVTWTECAGAKKYRIYRKTANTAWEIVGHTKKLAFTDTTAAVGKTYWYTVRCETADGSKPTSWFDNTGKKITYAHYILNTKSMKFHYDWCGSAHTISAANYAESYEARSVLIKKGYAPCGNCQP